MLSLSVMHSETIGRDLAAQNLALAPDNDALSALANRLHQELPDDLTAVLSYNREFIKTYLSSPRSHLAQPRRPNSPTRQRPKKTRCQSTFMSLQSGSFLEVSHILYK